MSSANITTGLITRGAAIAATRRISLKPHESNVVAAFLDLAEREGLDVQIDRCFVRNDDDLQVMFAEGAVLLVSQRLGRQFILLNVDAGTDSSGRRKECVLTYVGDGHEDAFIPGASYDSMARALMSISSLYKKMEADRGASG